MSKKQILDLDVGGDRHEGLKINAEYARSYNDWRRKEELQKYKDRYGEGLAYVGDEDGTSSEEEDEIGEQLTEEIEKDFFVALSALKSRTSEIYSKDFVLFKQDNKEESVSKKKSGTNKKTDAPLFLRDYERKVVLEKGGVLDDEGKDNTSEQRFSEHPESYAAEQRKLKESFKKALEINDDEGDENLLKKREKTKEDEVKEEAEYLEWLKGHKKKLDSNEDARKLKHLKKEWSKPELDQDEKFLRDYILNRRYREEGSSDIPTYDEIVNEDEETLDEDEEDLERQENFERKYNFRFEEPDDEFIKSYPRTIKDSVRRQDKKRKEKRQDLKERKEKEKQRKRQELKEMRKLQEEEDRKKLEQLRKESGKSDIPFESLEGDFNPEEHDKLMAKCFGSDYYDQTTNEDEKPEFSDSESGDDMANWDNWVPDEENTTSQKPSTSHSEFDNEIHDFDTEQEQEVGKRRRRRRSKFAEAIGRKKPKYDSNQDFEEYFDKYYGLNYEDFVGDKPCRFKYRNVPQNDFGLSVDEILCAPDRELNAWASLKKSIQYRADQEEKFDVQVYKKKSENLQKKKRVIPTLFKPQEDANDEINEDEKEIEASADVAKESKNKMEKSKGETEKTADLAEDNLKVTDKNVKKKKKKKNKAKSGGLLSAADAYVTNMSDERLKAYGINPKKMKKKIKYMNKNRPD